MEFLQRRRKDKTSKGQEDNICSDRQVEIDVNEASTRMTVTEKLGQCPTMTKGNKALETMHKSKLGQCPTMTKGNKALETKNNSHDNINNVDDDIETMKSWEREHF